MDIGRGLRRALRWTGRIPSHSRLLYPFWLASQLEEVRDNRLLRALPPAFDGITIAYASDIHYGPLLNTQRLQSLAARLNAMGADILLLGGDYGEDTQTAIRFFEQIPALKATMGKFCVMGNHDHMGTPQAYDKLLSTMVDKGFTPLINSTHTIMRQGTSLCLCATDDVKRGRPDFEPLLFPAAQADFCIFAPHSPDAIPKALIQDGFVFHLALCGHTHGGQLVVMGRSLHSSSKYGDRYRSGWMKAGDSDLMVSNGVGTSLLPMRLGAPAQIHLITLRCNP